MKKTQLSLFFLLILAFTKAQETDSTQMQIDQIEKSLVYQTGLIELGSGNARITVPQGFRFLDKDQSYYVLSTLWGNPPDSTVIGMLVPANRGVLDNKSWAFSIVWNEMGYVKDDDASDIDYEELLKEGKKETKEENIERQKLGYKPIEFVGWASQPFYDKDKKILHWAKEFKFGSDSINTLNYNLRILGRKGIFIVNAIASMPEINEVKPNIDKVTASIQFHDGQRYSDFDDGNDNVAAWTVGGLVAGKILAKVGFFALLLKFWKLIALGVIGGATALWKRFKGKKENEEKTVVSKKDVNSEAVAPATPTLDAPPANNTVNPENAQGDNNTPA